MQFSNLQQHVLSGTYAPVFDKELTHTISLHPSFLGPQLRHHVTEKLYRDVEGTCTGRYGYIVTVLALQDFGMAKVIPGIGSAEFQVRYKAIVFRPFKGEVCDGAVSIVNKMGIFVDIGPLQVFVSQHLIPSDFEFEPNSNPPAYQSEDQKIEKDTRVRLKIVGTRVDATELFAIGTIKEDYLGVIQ
ncbi:DNA-directed RNA polymerase II subunit [Mycoemilia scoparia]|uniref:DNA-directed RNA polymerase II subunit n=1 Tax=Mycoemilia scoparia TaxID=417184 RepID=A0A9W8A5A5_9FUNG|nr:DNA-directed RNA polymerase II subunit [Mycoemilia scoparia]